MRHRCKPNMVAANRRKPRILPSEGRGRTFESCRVRQDFNGSGLGGSLDKRGKTLGTQVRHGPAPRGKKVGGITGNSTTSVKLLAVRNATFPLISMTCSGL